jgi:rhomboid protease GluP
MKVTADGHKSSRLSYDRQMRAPVTTAIIVINVLIFVAMASTRPGIIAFPQATVIEFGGSSGVETIARAQLWRLVTSAFIHSGLLHLAINMIVLARLGPQVEQVYGSARYFGIYMAAAIAGGIASVAANPLLTTVGASGALLGIYAAQLVYIWQNPEKYPPGCLKVNLQVLAGLAISMVVCGMMLREIDNAAHFAGFAFGAIAAVALQPQTSDAWPKAAALAAVLAAACVIAVVALPRNGAIYFTRAGLLHKEGKDREAIDLVTQAIEINPEIAVAYNNRAWFEAALHDAPAALRDADQAIRLDPKAATTYDTRAMAYILLRQPDKAVADLDKALELKSDDGAFFYHRAVAKALLKDRTYKQDLAQAQSMKFEREPWEPTVVSFD